MYLNIVITDYIQNGISFVINCVFINIYVSKYFKMLEVCNLSCRPLTLLFLNLNQLHKL